MLSAGSSQERHEHRYRGHRAYSFFPEDVTELVELRARQRTFDGAYGRSAMGSLGYAIVVLKLFDRRFYHIGLLYAIMSGLLFIISFFRSRHSRHDFADCYRTPATAEAHERSFGRPFVTAGWIVIAVTAVVAAVEIVLFALIMEL